jgi:hypothetical protein
MTNEHTPNAAESPATNERADAAISATPEPEAVAAAPEELAQDDYEPAPRVIQMSRPLFFTLAGLAVAAILAFGATTAWLLIDRRGTDDPVVATVNGEQIRRSEYDHAVASTQGPDILDGLVTERLIMSEAKRRNVTADDGELQKAFDDQRQRFSSDDEWQGALAQANLTEAELRHQILLNTLIRKMVADKTQVTDDEVNSAYTASADRYAGQPVDAAKDQVRKTLVSQKENAAARDLIDQVRASAKIQTNLPGKTS